jgi:Ca-activated chloride channel family protein
MFPQPAKLCLLGPVCAALLAAQPPTTFKTNVNLVRVVATAKTKAGEIVGSLQKDDFEVYDNGIRQQISVFEHQTEQALSVALLVDISGSTAKELKYESDSASRFLHALLREGNPADQVALYTFNYEVRLEKDFSRDLHSIDTRLKLLHAEAGTALYDAVYLAGLGLEPRAGRKVMVIVTDGGDTFSKKSLKGALEQAQLADAIIYPIVVMPITNEAGRNVGGEHALQFMAEGTGGRPFFPNVGAALDKAFTDIITELRTQYLIGFYPQNVSASKNRFHTLEVRVKRPDLQVSARNGYYGEFEGAGGSEDDRVTISPERQKKKK